MSDKKRLLTVYDQFRARYDDAPKKMSFNSNLEFSKWKHDFFKKLKELIGPFPEKVPLDIEVLEEEFIEDFEDGGLNPFKQLKIVYNTESYASCVAYLLIPGDLKSGEKRPAILNAHGHGSGKKKMIGWDPVTWSNEGMPNYEAPALHLVKEGYIVIAPDWRPFGERDLNPEFTRTNRDKCNVTQMAFKYFGFNLLALNVWDAMRSIDVLETLDCVDNNKIGMIGKSYGGTMTTYTTIFDERIKASVISGYLSTLNDAMSMRGLGNFCGSQFLPGLLEWGDILDVFGLIAPRPLLIESGINDKCFVIDDTDVAYEKLQKIYAAANGSNNLYRDRANVEHKYIFNNVIPFFKKYLS